MASRRRAAVNAFGQSAEDEPPPKRRSSRQAALALGAAASTHDQAPTQTPPSANGAKRSSKPRHSNPASSSSKRRPAPDRVSKKASSPAPSDDLDPDDVPAVNPEAVRHDGEWYWLMKAEPETRLENGIDVSFSIDDLRIKKKPEPWDGIRAYAARNHLRSMNAGDKAFFYHSNCKEPGIVGIMEIVKEFSEDSTWPESARRPGSAYYDPASTKDKARWSLVHVEFRTKFALPISLREMRELGKPGGPLEHMQMLKQSRLSVSRVSGDEWETLRKLADNKALEAGLQHEHGKFREQNC